MQYFIMGINSASEVSRTTSQSLAAFLLCSQGLHQNLELILELLLCKAGASIL